MKASDNVFPKVLFEEGAGAATPATGEVVMYAKTDGLLYAKDDAGTETQLGGGGSGSGDVVGPASSTDGNFALFDGATGKMLKEGGAPGGMALIDDAPSDGSTYGRKDGAWAVAAGSGDVTGPASSTADAVALFSGTGGKTLKDGVTIATIRSIPQNSKSADYTAVLADAGGHIFHPSADTTGRTFTIPANASVAYPVGTALTFVNQNGAGSVTIAITTDTMRLAGAGTTGSRTLAANGIATALKITSTAWIISGTGLT